MAPPWIGVTQTAVFDGHFDLGIPQRSNIDVSSTIGCFTAFATHELYFIAAPLPKRS